MGGGPSVNILCMEAVDAPLARVTVDLREVKFFEL